MKERSQKSLLKIPLAITPQSTPEYDESDQGGDYDKMWEQNASTFEIDMNKLDDGDVEGFMIQGKQGYRDTMRNKIFIQNQYGFIWEPKPEA